MLNTVSANAVLGLPDPLQSHVNLQRVTGQIQTRDFEQVHVRSVTGIDGSSGEQPLGGADSAERGRILESLRYRADRPLTPPMAPVPPSPVQAAAEFRRIYDYLVTENAARDPANRAKSISVFA
ncbi:MAG: hypothetical protein H7838_01585 [Magnetococcus sp. DMHC-8]